MVFFGMLVFCNRKKDFAPKKDSAQTKDSALKKFNAKKRFRTKIFFLHDYHLCRKKLHGDVTRSAIASSQPLPMFTTSYIKGTWVSGLTQYAV